VIPALSSHHLNLSDEAATRAFAESLATQLKLDVSVLGSGLVIFLSGSLGAGKTTWVRGLLNALGHQGRVRSPSFTIMEPYTLGTLQIYHFDFYRFTASEEWREAGFDELIDAPGSLSLVEWPEMAEQSLAPPDWWMRLGILGSDAATEAQTQAQTEIDSSASRTLDIQCFSAVGANLATRVLNQ
jgi:tRNA threonylcarbamoyladenosine biosynthesis protein TsaE